MTETIVDNAGESNHHYSKHILGFWVYLMTDLIIFAGLFAVYAVLRNNTFGGPGGRELFDMKIVTAETFILLCSSFTCGLAMLGVYANNLKMVYAWFSATFALGLTFLIFELREFSHLISTGNSWQRSGFLSGYFGLLGTHGLHIAIGLLWLFIILCIVSRRGLTPKTISLLTRFSLFWHFLDIVWIFIFTVVYLLR